MGNLFIADSGNHRIRRVDAGTGNIDTIAGDGTPGFAGEGTPAAGSQLSHPSDIAIDSSGNLFIADRDNGRLRRIDAGTTNITTVAGTGIQSDGRYGDGALATDAQLDSPTGVTIGVDGDLFVAQRGHDRVRRIDVATGLISTAAGRVFPKGMGPLATARLADPGALVVASAFTLVAGGSSGTIQAIRTSGLESVTGRYNHIRATGALARFREDDFVPVAGVAYDEAGGNLFFSTPDTNQVYVVSVVDPADANTWTLDTFVNDTNEAGYAEGAVADARLRGPTGLFLDPGGPTLYIADTGNHAIRAVDLSSGLGSATVSTVFGVAENRGFAGDGGSAAAALLFRPRAITRCGTDFFIADTGNQRVRRVDASGDISTVFGDGVPASSGEGSPATDFPVNTPLGLACDSFGNLFVSSTTTIKLLLADETHTIKGDGEVKTILGAPPRTEVPDSLVFCLSGVARVDDDTIHVTDSCTGMLIELKRTPR
jgi:sugar lactone lactonase YvrE